MRKAAAMPGAAAEGQVALCVRRTPWATSAQWLHVGHPKMVGERTDLAHRLFEGVLDLEAQTIRPGIPPSELVVATALRQRLPKFLLDADQNNIFTNFVAERQDTNKMQAFRLAA